MTKKNFVFTLALVAMLPLQKLQADSIPLPLQIVIDNPINNEGGHRMPIQPPTVSIDDHTLYFWDSCAFLIYIKEEDEDGNEQVVYTTIVTADETSITLPTDLEGTYAIEVIRGEQCFVGEIEL